MKKEEYETKLNEITKKIGDEASNLILDDIGLLLNDNEAMNQALEDSNKENENLKSRIEVLQNVNGNLLKQVSTGHVDLKKEETPKKEDFDFSSLFDKNGEFK